MYSHSNSLTKSGIKMKSFIIAALVVFLGVPMPVYARGDSVAVIIMWIVAGIPSALIFAPILTLVLRKVAKKRGWQWSWRRYITVFIGSGMVAGFIIPIFIIFPLLGATGGASDLSSLLTLTTMIIVVVGGFFLYSRIGGPKRRSQKLRMFAESNGFDMIPLVQDTAPYSDIVKDNVKIGHMFRIKNLMTKENEGTKISIFDVEYTERYGSVLQSRRRFTTRRSMKTITLVVLQGPGIQVPKFKMKPETILNVFSADIDFPEYPKFSKKYLLSGDESKVREFFNDKLLQFFEANTGFIIKANLGTFAFHQPFFKAKIAEYPKLLDQVNTLIPLIIKANQKSAQN